MLVAPPTPSSPRVVLVTGATSGIGEACVRRFHAEGWHVVGWGRRKERLEDLGAELGERFLAQVLDVRDREAMGAALATLPGPWSAIDVLVNNAGLALGLEKAPEADLAEWDTMIDTNCRAVVALTRAVLPGMVARRRGHVLTIGSVAANYPYPGGNVYGATKAFVHQFMLNLRADLLGTPVRATVLEPGMVETEFSKVRFGGDEARANKTYEGIDAMTGLDIANAVFFCASLPPHVNVNVLEPVWMSYAHYVDPSTGLNVIADQAGNYVSGWRLGAEQLEGVLTTGRLF